MSKQKADDPTRLHYISLRTKPMLEAKPYLLPHLIKLGIPEKYAKTMTVGKAYNTIFRRLRQRMGFSDDRKITTHYWLWTKGVALDALAKMTRGETNQLLQMLSGVDHKSGRPAETETICR